MGTAPAFEQHSGAGSSAPVGFGNARQITFNQFQLPLPVLSALQAQAGAETLSRLEQGTWHGIPAYEAVVGQAGKQAVLLIGADGKILSRQ